MEVEAAATNSSSRTGLPVIGRTLDVFRERLFVATDVALVAELADELSMTLRESLAVRDAISLDAEHSLALLELAISAFAGRML